jgi:murein L,D-transpeptidase YafK
MIETSAGDRFLISKTRHWRKRALFFGLLVCAGILFAAPRPKHPDKILIEKSKRTLTLLNNGEVLKTYKVALGSQPIGPKDRQGDHKTPEGLYYVDRKVPNSTFYKALHLTYPSPADRAHAKKLGLSPGGDVEIHGLGAKFGFIGAAHRLHDWTDGCIALTNQEIDEIYPQIEPGTPVEIKP